MPPRLQQVRPRGVLPSELPKGVVRRYLELVVNDQEVVASQGLGKRVGLSAQLPDVVGMGEAGKVGVLRRAVLSVRRRGVGVALRVDLELAQRVSVGVRVLV